MKFEKLSFRLFVILFCAGVVFSYIANSTLFEKSEKPWHMQPFEDEDILSKKMLEEFEVVGAQRLSRVFTDSSKRNVMILVDAWGVSFDDNRLKEDFKIFENVPHKKYLHERIANRTRHAEFAEFRNSSGEGLYLFGGDSLEYGRNLYVDSLGYSDKIFCQMCSDSTMIAKLDSVLLLGENRTFAMTMQNSRDGVREHLHATLKLIANVAKKHPEVRFIVQGTHRPILGDPKIRKAHFAKWVPVLVLN